LAHGISEPDPCEVKQLMHQNAGQFSRLTLQLLVKHDLALSNEGSGVNRLTKLTIGI
jgi:hypothetical protein